MTTPTERTRALLRVPELVDAMVRAKTQAERRRIAAHMLRHYPFTSDVQMIAQSSFLLNSDYAMRWADGEQID